MASSTYPQTQTAIAYSTDHALQTLTICLPRAPDPADPTNRIWIVYIHGGAWRDPSKSSADFAPALGQLLARPEHASVLDRIAGFASINYGLSPHPNFPSTDPSRCLTHPEHVNDVLKALAYLARHHGLGLGGRTNWILVGHSCGATMAFHTAFALNASAPGAASVPEAQRVPPPRAIVALEGLYDLPALVRRHAAVPAYRDFVAAAFGAEEAAWREASPALCGEALRAVWRGTELVVLAQSREDELVEWEQVEGMRAGMEENRPEGEEGRGRMRVLELEGTHDGVWRDGEGVVKAIRVAVDHLFSGT